MKYLLAAFSFLSLCGGLAPEAWGADAAKGKQIFEQVCAYCHRLDDKAKFGPGLKGITERVSVEWLNAWLKDPVTFMKTDEYARNLQQNNKFGMTMPAIPEMRDDEKRANVIEFLKTLK